MQLEGPAHRQHEHWPAAHAVPSGLLLVMHPPAPSQTEAVWQSDGVQV